MLKGDRGLLDAPQRLQVRGRQRQVLGFVGRAAGAHVAQRWLDRQRRLAPLDFGRDVGPQLFKGAHWNARRKLFVAAYGAEAVLTSKGGLGVGTDDLHQQSVLCAGGVAGQPCQVCALPCTDGTQVQVQRRIGKPVGDLLYYGHALSKRRAHLR